MKGKRIKPSLNEWIHYNSHIYRGSKASVPTLFHTLIQTLAICNADVFSKKEIDISMFDILHSHLSHSMG